MFTTEYFGPILGVHVYDDARFEDVVAQAESASPYGLTGSIFADRPPGGRLGRDELRYAAGNFYINDKPTGAVVGQQPFGGARASGTNDKAGSWHNLHPLDVTADHQGDIRAADRPRVPAHGVSDRKSTDSAGPMGLNPRPCGHIKRPFSTQRVTVAGE